SALNEELDRMDAEYGIAVFWKAFLSNREGFVMGVPSVPLGDLYSWNGGDVHTRCSVSELCFENGRIAGVRLDESSIALGDYYIPALRFDRLLKILPAALRDEPPYVALKHLELSPITGVHLWFDRSVMPEPFITSVDQTIQWVFNKDGGRYLQIVISASR